MPNSPSSTAIQRVLFGCVSAVLICSARLPVMPASSTSSSLDDVGEEPGEADDEQQQRDEEQEQPEGDGAADDRAGRLAVALVDAQADVDERAVAVLLEQLVRRGPARPQPLARRAASAFTPVGGFGPSGGGADPVGGSGVTVATSGT